MIWEDYTQWVHARMNVITDNVASGFFQRGHRVLIPGCGDSQTAAVLAAIGARVVISDARSAYVSDGLARYHQINAGIVADLDEPWVFGNHYDCIVHMGLLYHLKDPAAAIRDAVTHCRYLILETQLSGAIGDAATCVEMGENKGERDHAFNGLGARFSAAWVERQLKAHDRTFRRIADVSMNVRDSCYTWTVGHHGSADRGLWLAQCPTAPAMWTEP